MYRIRGVDLATMSNPKSAPPVAISDAVSARLLADVESISRRMAARIASDIPLSADFRTVGYLRLVLRACRDGIGTLIRALHAGRRPHPAELSALGAAGARQAELGVPLEVLLAAYRLAAKVVWREVVTEATQLGELDPATVVDLTEQVLEYLDDISAAVGSAYLVRREEIVRQRDRERDRLLRRLVAGESSTELRRLSVLAGLELSPPYRALAVAAARGDADRILGQALHRWSPLLVGEGLGSWIVLVDAAAPVDELLSALGMEGGAAGTAREDGTEPALVIAVGPTAARLEDVGGAVDRARRALAVGRRLDPAAVAHDDRDVGALAVIADHPAEARAYADRHLRPVLDDARRSGELLATLDAVLSTRGLGEAAAVLDVHRHTVVYRLARLRDLLGVDLDDAVVRHRLWLALLLHRLESTGAH
jgi:hypothetical protein